MTPKQFLAYQHEIPAILDGRQTQFRRVIKPQPNEIEVYSDRGTEKCRYVKQVGGKDGPGWAADIVPAGMPTCIDLSTTKIKCPYRPGDLLYVAETWAAIWPDADPVPLEQCIIQYRADAPKDAYPGDWPAEEAKGNPDAPKWRPSIHMPKWAARIWLEVTAVRVERVQDITLADVIAEGLKPLAWVDNQTGQKVVDERGAFVLLWDEMNGKRPGCSWDDNPFVFVVEFKRVGK